MNISRVDVLLKGCGWTVDEIECPNKKGNLCIECSSRLSELLEAYKEELDYRIKKEVCNSNTVPRECAGCKRYEFLRSEIVKGEKK